MPCGLMYSDSCSDAVSVFDSVSSVPSKPESCLSGSPDDSLLSSPC